MNVYRVRVLFLLTVCLALLSGNVQAAYRGLGNTAAPAEMSGTVALHAAGRGNPWLNLRDGMPLAVTYEGSVAATQAMALGAARPLALTADDFDEDGVPDLVVGYDSPASLALHRGNVDAIYPNAPQAEQRKADGRFTAAPFLSPARIFGVPAAPDFLGTGDFDNDGHRDVVFAAREDAALYLLPGDGLGGFGPAQRVPLPGSVTALLVGDLYLPDGLADLAVGLALAEGSHAVLIFWGPAGALHSDPVQVSAPAPVTSLARVNVDGSGPVELVAAVGQELLIIHEPDIVEHVPLPYPVVALTVGNFGPGENDLSELALLDDDGTLHVVDVGNMSEIVQQRIAGFRAAATQPPQLVRARVSSHTTDDLLLLDIADRQIRVFQALAAETDGPEPVSLDSTYEPVALLPMRLNPDALDDLVLLGAGLGAPVVVPTAPLTTFTVNTTAHSFDANPGDGVCRDGLGRCSLYAAISEAGAWPGHDEIRFDLGLGIPTLEWDEGFPYDEIREALTIRGDTGGATRVALGGGRIVIDTSDAVIRGLAIPEGIKISANNTNDVVEGCHLGPPSEVHPQGLLSITSGRGHQIGGTTEQARNVVVGNRDVGIYVHSCSAEWDPCQIQGNYVGLAADGVTPQGNGGQGIYIRPRFGNYIVVGGIEDGAGNVVAATTANTYGGGGDGIEVFYNNASGGQQPGPVLIQGNHVGTDASGRLGPGNRRHGVKLTLDVWYTTIGGPAVGAGNVIAGNEEVGVCLDGDASMSYNPIRGNAIYANGGIGIDLDDDGPTANDPGDSDGGANRLQNWPEISDVALDAGELHVTFRVDSSDTSPGSHYPLQIDFFAGEHAGVGTEGKAYLGSVEYLESEAQTWVAKSFAPQVVPPILGLIVATATDADGNTSEFSAHYGGKDIVVTTIGDEADANPGDGVCAIAGGGCTLRAAIETANARAGGDVIAFNIPGTAIPIIGIESALPAVTLPVYIDGTTQPGGGRVLVSGEGTPSGTDGLTLSGGGNTLRGLAIAGFDGHGIVLKTRGKNVIQGCQIGAVWDVATLPGNGGDGVHVMQGALENLIGGLGQGNVIAGNGDDGLEFDGGHAGGNEVLGNYVGTDAASAVNRGNGAHGILISGALANVIEKNVISDNGRQPLQGAYSGGVGITGEWGMKNVLIDNRIGTTVAGDAALGNHGPGVYILGAPWNYLAQNVISANEGSGIMVFGKHARENVVVANYIGTNAAGTAALGNDDAGVWIFESPRNQVGAITAMAGSRLTGGNLVSGNRKGGIGICGEEATGNEVLGNIVGLDAAAGATLPNGADGGSGVEITAAADNRVEDNLVAGNVNHGIKLEYVNNTRIYRNYVGTNLAGAAGLGNGQAGVLVSQSPWIKIGGPNGLGNVIGNNATGILHLPGPLGAGWVVHNLIGTDRGGASIPNEKYGLEDGGIVCNNKIWHNGTVPEGAGVNQDKGGLICLNSVAYNAGIGIHNQDRATVRGNAIHDNGGDAGLVASSHFSAIKGNNIVGNAGYGLRSVDASGPADAEHNWWGDASGPGGEGPGSGDEVSTNVDYDPWLLAPVGVTVVPATDPAYSPPGNGAALTSMAQQATASTWLFFQNWVEPDDVLTVTLSDTEGWLLLPTTFDVALEDGLGASLPISVALPAGTPPGTVNEVTVTAVSQAEPSNSDTETFQVIAALTADLSVVVADPDLATTVPYQYTITVTNDGPDAATGVVLTDTLPITATFASAQASQGTCAPQGGLSGAVVVCQLGALANGAQAEISVTAFLTSIADTAVVNVVEVWGSEHDNDPVDNFDAAYTPVGVKIYMPLVMRWSP